MLVVTVAMLAAACSPDPDDGAGPTTTAGPDAATSAGPGTTIGGGEGGGEGGVPTVELSPDDLDLVSTLRAFDECDALLAHLRTEGAARVGPYGFDHGGVGVFRGAEDMDLEMDGDDEEAVDEMAPAATAAATDGAVVVADSAEALVEGEDFSGTNVAEVGVDEPDVVKTDGERIVVVSGGDLVVVDAASGEVTGRTSIAQGWGPELFLSGDAAVLVTHGTGEEFPVEPRPVEPDADIAAPHSFGPATTVQRVDLSGEPAVIQTMQVDGDWVSARAVDGVIRIVLRTPPAVGLPFVLPSSPTAEDRAAELNREVVMSSELDDWLPRYTLRDGGDQASVTDEGLAVPCEGVHAPTTFAGFGVLSVLSLPADGALSADEATAVLAPGDIVYASPSSLVVATSAFTQLPVDVDVDEQDWQQAWEDRRTSLHRFAFTDAGADYTASGSVPGDVRDQFSLSEHDGHLRVVTTTGDTFDESSVSFVRVLREDGEELVEVGSVGDLGNGEAVQSVRFVGDTAYVVTFRQIDPFYTVDLSDPENPRVVGELKIPGFSSYLHPIGDGLVIGVGSAADEQTGQVTGAKVSLFDVTDPAAPVETATWVAPDGWNDVGWEHRAFLWWEPERLAVLPVQVWSEGFSGAVALRVEGDTITEVGRISHETPDDAPDECAQVTTDDVDIPDNPPQSEFVDTIVSPFSYLLRCGEGEQGHRRDHECHDQPWLLEQAEPYGLQLAEGERLVVCYQHHPEHMIVRSLVIDDDLWTLSYLYGDTGQPATLQANTLSDLAVTQTVAL